MRILRNTNLMIVGMVILMAWLLISNLAFAADEIENLVIGGDFEEDIDMTHWTVNGDATIEMDKKEAAVGDASLFFEINGIDPDKAWQPQFRQVPYGTAMAVEKDTYTLSVFLKAESNRDIQIVVWYDPGDERVISEWVGIGTEWEEYSFTAEWPKATLAGIRFLNAGAGKISYWVDCVRFYEGEYVPTEIEDEKAVVDSSNSLITAWASIKAQY